ncbi:MAG: TonB-dependent receptor plug domain-containing protein [Azospirillaceae bacterium]|nr:TonB-dependent receptor plug domain-containing protein [Azospirillaceae bacterium]
MGTSTIALAAGAAFAAAPAQDPAAPDPQQPASAVSDELQEVVITARRHAETAQTVPVSVTVIDSSTLASAGLESTSDLQRMVPGVILNGSGSDANTTYTIRGQSRAVIGPGLPSALTYLNDVPLTRWGAVLPTFDVDGVQILKGPQGTLFGRNTTGGAVLVNTVKPGFDVNGYVQADIGNYAKHNFQGAINIPVVDNKLAFRIAGDIEQRNGYTSNISTGKDQDNVNSKAVRFSVLLKPTEWLQNTTVFDYYHADDNNSGVVAVTPPVSPVLWPAITALQGQNPYTNASTTQPFSKVKVWGVSNTTEAEFDDFSIKNIFGYRSSDVDQVNSATGLGLAPMPFPLASLGVAAGTPVTLFNNYNAVVEEQFTEELQFSGTAFNKSLTWLVGAFYLKEQPTGPDYLAEDLFRPSAASASPTSLYITQLFGGIWPAGTLADNLYTDESKAVFANVSYDLSHVADALHGFKLNAGLRYTWDKEGVCANSKASIDFATGLSVVAPYNSLAQCQADKGGTVGSALNPYYASYQGSASFEAPTYTLGVDYEVNDNLFFYFTTRRGYRAGGINAPAQAPILQPYQTYQPQTVTDYEVGAHVKWRVDEWAGRFNIAAFTASYTNYQLEATGIIAGSLPGVTAINQPANTALTLNAGDATFQGVEVDGLISPFRGLDFTYSASYLYPKYDSLNVASFLSAGGFFKAGPFSGTPRWSYSASLNYKLPFQTEAFDAHFVADYYHMGSVWQTSVLLPAYDLTSFNLRFSNIMKQDVDLTLYVDNAFDAKYIHNILLGSPSFGTYSGSYGAPRMFGARLRYGF